MSSKFLTKTAEHFRRFAVYYEIEIIIDESLWKGGFGGKTFL
jgi:hypothetical protein